MKTILIAVGNAHFKFNNTHSAVASYLNTFKNHLERQDYNVVLSDSVSEKASSTSNTNSTSNKSSLKSLAKKVVPRFIRKVADKKSIKQIDALTSELLEKIKPDFVIEFLDYYSQIAFAFKEKYNIPYLLIYDAPIQQKYIDIHGHTSGLNNVLKKRESDSISNADHIICYSKPVWDYVQKHFSTNVHHEILPTIVWERMVEKESELEDEIISIGFIGSFLKWHYVDVLARVFNQLADKHANIELVLIGYGLEWENIKTQIDGYKHKDRIKMTGFVDDTEMQGLKNKMDIGVMAGSNWYGSPLKIFEYAKLNIPVIGPDSPTVLDLFEAEKELLVVDSNSSETSLYNHLESLIINPNLRKQLAGALRTKVDTAYSKKYYFSCFDGIIEASLTKV
ncbi:MAG: glycosyltransferase family 4 protein [Bacteroidia bacterium]|nr:glycosyltransferase family 4 protein [Bacteroidia bacterium]